MILPTTLTGSVIFFLVRIIQVYNILILLRVLASWIIRDPYNQIYHFLFNITEPVLAPIRRIIPAVGVDFSPIIAYFLLSLLTRILISLI